MIFSLRAEPDQRLDLSPLVPSRLKELSGKEIEAIELQTTKWRLTVGDIFKLRTGDPDNIRIEGSCSRLDQIGQGLSAGTIIVEGDAGARVGRLMAGGTLDVMGNAGPWTGSGMKGGRISVAGNVGDWLGGPLAGELSGMRGGFIYVKGHAGHEAGHRLRRGTIAIEKTAGAYAGRSMVAGTLFVGGRAGSLPGYLMKRGTIVLGQTPESLSPTFNDCGVTDLVFARLLMHELKSKSVRAAGVLAKPIRRLAGDLAAGGKGELLVAL